MFAGWVSGSAGPEASDAGALGVAGRERYGPSIEEEATLVGPRFDRSFYLASNPDVAQSGVDPVRHYCEFGWREGRDPTPEFSTAAYLHDHPALAAAGTNPFWHCLRTAEAARNGNGAQAAEASPDPSEDELAAVRQRLDAGFYLEANADVRSSGCDPVEHYCRYGWKEGRDPAPGFSTAFYLEANADVTAAGINPFHHFIVFGEREGRAPRPQEPVAEPVAEPELEQDLSAEIAFLRPHLDGELYLARSPDVAAAGVDPVEHYCLAGWREGRDPSADFSTSYYLENNPDVSAAGTNPFLHYIRAGRDEGRPGRHPGGHKAEMLRAQRPLEECVRHWRQGMRPPHALMAAVVVEERIRQTGRRRLVVSVGHDNHRRISGGVQLCMQREEQRAAASGTLYLNVHPWQPLPRLAHPDEDPNPIMRLMLDGAEIGACRTSAVIEAVAAIAPELDEVRTVLHHMLGHMPERLVDLVRASGSDSCFLWLHDYLTICPSFALQRNGVTFCGAPERTSNACTHCLYGRERQSHVERMAALFDELDVHVLSPSQVTRDFWERKAGLNAASVAVSPHLRLTEVERESPLPLEADAPATVAFAGTPAAHKGWPVFERLAREHREHRFVFFGRALPPTSRIEHVPVHATADDPDAMVEALASEKVDLVVHWATWPETFSLTAHEALAAGAFVLTNAGSGNVAAVVERYGRGRILGDEDDLVAFFGDGRLEEVVRERRESWSARAVTAALNLPCYLEPEEP